MKRLIPLLLTVCIGCSEPATSGEDQTALGEVVSPEEIPIEVVILAPADGTWWNHSSVLVSGTVSGVSDGTVLVNGVAAPLLSGMFSAWVTLDEGANALVVVHPESDESAQITLNVDRLPPILTPTAPARGSVVELASSGVSVQFTATDENGLDSVQAGGVPVSVDAVLPQSVIVTAPLKPGVNLLTAEATDKHTNLAREHRAVLAGPFLPCQDLANAPTAMLVLGSQALEVLGQATSQMLASMDFGAYLVDHNPLYSSESFVVTVQALELVQPTVLLSTAGAPSGRMAVSFQVQEVVATGTLAMLGAGGQTFSFKVQVEELTLALSADVGLSQTLPKVVQVVPQDIVTDAFALTLELKDQQGNDVVPSTEVSGNFLNAMGEMAASFASDALTNVLAGALPQSSGTQALDVLGMPITFSYTLLDLSLSPAGLSVTLAARGEVTADPLHPWTYGCPGPIPALPVPTAHPGIQVWLSYPFLNSVFISLWQQGWMDFKIDQARMDAWKSQMTLVCGMLGSLLGSSSPQQTEAPLVVDVVPSLPPQVATSALHPGALNIAVGDLQLAFRCGVDPNPVASAWLSMELGALLSVIGGKIHVGLAVDRFFLDTEGLSETAKRVAEREMETFFEQTIQQIAGAVVSSLVSFQSPGGYGLIPMAGSVGAGTPEGWLTVQAVAGMEVQP